MSRFWGFLGPGHNYGDFAKLLLSHVLDVGMGCRPACTRGISPGDGSESFSAQADLTQKGITLAAVRVYMFTLGVCINTLVKGSKLYASSHAQRYM